MISVAFDPDSYELAPEADAQPELVADRIADYPDGGTLDIVGYTDDIVDDDYNRTLSENRAAAAADRLGAVTDLSAWTVIATGKGETEPASADTTDEARAQNRRVVMTATPVDGTSNDPSQATPTATAAPGDWVPEPEGPASPRRVRASTSPRARMTRGAWSLGRVRRAPRRLPPGHVQGDRQHRRHRPASLVRQPDDLAPGQHARRGRDMWVYNGAAEPHPAGRRQALPAHRLPAPRGSPRPPVDTWFQAGIDDATADLCVVWPDLNTDTVVIDRGISPRLPKMDRPYRFLDVPVTEG